MTLDLDPNLDKTHLLDGRRLTQIVTNLIDNAAKFATTGETCIAVRTLPDTHVGHDTHGLKISVADTGQGINDDQQQRIFDRFTQIADGID